MRGLTIRLVLTVACSCSAFEAAAIVDEIQVYTDDIDERGAAGLEVHLHTTTVGRSTPNYPGDVPPRHSTQLTPEFSYGFGHDLEGGLYIPTTTVPGGGYEVAGFKLRLKWLPIRPEEGGAGWFAGANLEFSDISASYSASRYNTELRLIVGYRAEHWLIAMNPIFEWALSSGYRDAAPDTTLAWKAGYEVWPGIMLGGEYYRDVGKLTSPLPENLQERTLYAVIDYEHKPWALNFGVGRGLTANTDRWIIKAIFGVAF